MPETPPRSAELRRKNLMVVVILVLIAVGLFASTFYFLAGGVR